MSFTLEVKGWVDFEVERYFDDYLEAKRFGNERYSQNDWRIRDIVSNNILYEHNPIEVIESVASSESTRFRLFDNWQESVARSRRLASIATRQRRSQRLRRSTRSSLRSRKKRSSLETVNWMVEGF